MGNRTVKGLIFILSFFLLCTGGFLLSFSYVQNLRFFFLDNFEPIHIRIGVQL